MDALYRTPESFSCSSFRSCSLGGGVLAGPAPCSRATLAAGPRLHIAAAAAAAAPRAPANARLTEEVGEGEAAAEAAAEAEESERLPRRIGHLLKRTS